MENNWIKEFYVKFVEPTHTQMRAMNTNGEAYVIGTAIEIKSFISDLLSEVINEALPDQDCIHLTYHAIQELKQQLKDKYGIS